MQLTPALKPITAIIKNKARYYHYINSEGLVSVKVDDEIQKHLCWMSCINLTESICSDYQGMLSQGVSLVSFSLCCTTLCSTPLTLKASFQFQ